MAVFTRTFVQDLQGRIETHITDGLVFSADNESNIVNVELYNGTSPATLTGNVAVYAIREDGNTVAFAGTLTDNVASAVLPQSCFVAPGPLAVMIQIVSGDVKTTVLRAVFTVVASSSGAIIDPGHVIPDISDIIAMLDDLEEAIADAEAATAYIAPTETSPAESAHSVGEYIIYNGTLYEVTASITVGASLTVGTNISAVTNGFSGVVSGMKGAVNKLPYKQDYDVAGKNLYNPNSHFNDVGYFMLSSGALYASSAYVVSGFIPVVAGEKYAIKTNAGSAAYHGWYKGNGELISTFASTASGAVATAPNNAEFLRVSVVKTYAYTQVEKGDAVTAYEPYVTKNAIYARLNDQISKIDNLIAKKADVEAGGKNLLNVNSPFIESGKFLLANGTTANNSSYLISNYIMVEASTSYVTQTGAGTAAYNAWYDADFNLISSFANNGGTAVVQTSPATAKYLRVSATGSTAMVEKGSTASAYEAYITKKILWDGLNTTNGQVSGISSNVNQINESLNDVLDISENIFDGVFVLNEQVATSTGNFLPETNVMRTGYIPLKSGVVTVGVQKNTVDDNKIIRCFCFYNAQKGKVESGFGSNYTVYTADDMKYQQITVPQNAVYFAFDTSMSAYQNDKFYVSQVASPTGYVAYARNVRPEFIIVDKTLTQSGIPADAKTVGDRLNGEGSNADKAISTIRGGTLTAVKSASLTAGNGLYSVRNSVIRNKTYVFNAHVSGNSWSILVAHGVIDNSFSDNSGSQGYVVTPTTAMIWVNGKDGESGTLGTVWTHGLTISDRLTIIISIDSEQKQTITLMSESGLASKSYAAQFNGRKGTVYAKALAGTFTDAMLSFACSDIEKPIWLFGDSYVSLVEDRYPYWLQQAHVDNCLINSYPGEASPNAILDCKALLNIGTPKFIVWGLGMNDHDTSSAVNADWLAGVQELAEICEASGITLILCTIPNVVNTSCNNVKKNAWIEASDFRYVDFNAAIGAADEPGASWPEGWLSSDNVHPTAMGARVLAGQILLDVPELIQP